MSVARGSSRPEDRPLHLLQAEPLHSSGGVASNGFHAVLTRAHLILHLGDILQHESYL